MKPTRQHRMYKKTRERVVKLWAREHISIYAKMHHTHVTVKHARKCADAMLTISEKFMAKTPYIMRGMIKAIKRRPIK